MLRIVLFALLGLAFTGCASTPQAKSQNAAAPATEAVAVEESAAAEAVVTKEAALSPGLNLDEIPFQAFNPEKPEGIHVYVISGSLKEGPFSAIVRFPPGMMSPLHSHSSSYSGVVMSENMVHSSSADDKETLPINSYWHQPAGEPHIDGCLSEEPCYLLVFMDGPVDMTPAEQPAAEPKAKITRGDAIPWQEVKAGVQMAVITGNPKEGPFQALFQFPAGMTTNVHTHEANFTGGLLAGTHHRGPAADALVTLKSRAVWNQPAGTPHMEKCGDEGPCLFAGAMDAALNTQSVEVTAGAAAETPAADETRAPEATSAD